MKGECLGVDFKCLPWKLCGWRFSAAEKLQTGRGIVVNLQNLPETEIITPKRSCLCVMEEGTLWQSFWDIK